MLRGCIDFLFGCTHSRLSFPMSTPADRNSYGRPQAHVTCLDCGKEFWYDWEAMRQTAERPLPVYPPVHGGKAA